MAGGCYLLAAGYLLRMDATAAVKAVRRSEQTEEQFFPSAEQQKEYQVGGKEYQVEAADG